MRKGGRRIALIGCLLLWNWVGVSGQTVYPDQLNIQKADSVAALFTGYAVTDLYDLSLQLTGPLSSDAEKFRAIYTWVCTNIKNNYPLFEENRRNLSKFQDQPEAREAWLKSYSPRVFQTLVNDHSTICTGYAYLIRELASHAGIECEIIHGYGRSAGANVGGEGIINHSWNAVKLDGSWFLCDPTWSSGGVDPRAGIFIPDYANDVYFLANPELFILNHYPSDSRWTLLENAPSLSQFLNAPVAYKKAYTHQAFPQRPSNLTIEATKGDTLLLVFKLNGALPDKIAVQYGKYAKRKVMVPEYDMESGMYFIRYPLNGKKNKELHVLMNDAYVWSYRMMLKE
jgi:hypothetical protein